MAKRRSDSFGTAVHFQRLRPQYKRNLALVNAVVEPIQPFVQSIHKSRIGMPQAQLHQMKIR
jgi:hypothetical protein